MGKKKVTLSIDDEIYRKFQKFCEERDIMLSKRVERIMISQLEKSKARLVPSKTGKLQDYLRGDLDGIE